jgi:hypothetical protein
MKRFAVILLALAGFAAANAAAQEKQFDFLIGQWDVEVRPKVSGIAAAIHGAPKLGGTWKAWRAMDGLAIEDELRILDASGNPISFTHGMRIYSKTDRRWKSGSLDAYRAHFNESAGEAVGGEIVMSSRGVDREGHAVMNRARYLDIGANGFRMLQERSPDEGKTWEETLTIVAKRTGAAPPR